LPDWFGFAAQAAVLASALSLDALVSGFAYGSNKIKIPFVSVAVISFICSAVLGISLLAGSSVRGYISQSLSVVICFGVLFVLGVVKLLDSITKSIIRKHRNIKRQLRFSLFNFRFILNLYANPEDADADKSKVLSPAEAASIAVAVSLDGAAVGFGAAMGDISGSMVFVFSLITTALAIMLGCFAGNRIAKKSSINLSWLAGSVLIALAFCKIL